MTGTEYQRKAMRTAQGLTEWDLLLNGVMGLCGEAGECIDLVKKYRFQGHQLDQEKLKDELGDVMWYVAITCQALGITLDDVIEHNVEKLLLRYPEGIQAHQGQKSAVRALPVWPHRPPVGERAERMGGVLQALRA